MPHSGKTTRTVVFPRGLTNISIKMFVDFIDKSINVKEETTTTKKKTLEM